jgi:peptidoglycan/LPS O-acetylase OafA/YrhL
MGLIRLLLALAVVLVHSPFPPWSRSPMVGGNIAVEAFFLISGFYMELVLTTRYRDASGRPATLPFWVSRALRLYPVYWIMAGAMLAFVLLTRPGAWQEAMHAFGPAGAVYLSVTNVIILGQDLTFWIGHSAAGLHLTANAVAEPHPVLMQFLLVPPAWTLSLELMFYLMVPFLTRLSSTALVTLAAASAAARVVAYLWFGLYEQAFLYQFFPFELMFFLMGMLACRMYHSGFVLGRKAAFVLYACFLAYLIGLRFIPRPHIIEKAAFDAALFGLMFLALPSIFTLCKDWHADRLIGELSYPIYLCHVPVYWVMAWVLAEPGHEAAKQALAMVSILLVATFLYWAVDRPLDAFRHGLASRRSRGALAPVIA